MRGLVALVVVALATSLARADVIGPDQEKCTGKQAGDACDGGACAARTCSRTLPPGPDGAPNETSYECMICVAGATPAGGGRLPIYAGIAVGVAALAAGIYFARRKQAT